MHSKYVYGIIDCSEDKALGVAGLGGMAYTVSYGGVGCVLSDYSAVAFSCTSKEQTVQCLLKHQEVVEHVMKQHTVLPVKFGTVLTGSDEVYDLLFQGHHQFTEVLAEMADKVEVEVAATWNIQQVLQEVSAEDDIVRAREAVAGGQGQATFDQRIQIGKLVKASLDRRRNKCQEEMMGFLKLLAVDAQPNAMVSDQMVMNVAFLLDSANEERFVSGVRQLNDLFHNRIDFRVVGPLPPYSFATIEVAKPSPQQLEEARHLLQLGEAPSENEVRRAYRHLAAETHPDSRPPLGGGGRQGDPAARSGFGRLRQASEMLIAHSRRQAGKKGSLSISINRHKADEVQHIDLGETEITDRAAHG